MGGTSQSSDHIAIMLLLPSCKAISEIHLQLERYRSAPALHTHTHTNTHTHTHTLCSAARYISPPSTHASRVSRTHASEIHVPISSPTPPITDDAMGEDGSCAAAERMREVSLRLAIVRCAVRDSEVPR
eukprot:342518-Rhodomonas_salina.1